MKVSSTSRLPIFRSNAQASILLELLALADVPLSLTDLADRAGVSLGAVHKEVERLEAAELVRTHRVGRSRLVEANPDSPFHHALRSLVISAFGPGELLAERLANIAGIDQSFIYGSWAASEIDSTADQPHDIDVMVIGRPDLDALHEALREVEAIVGRPVNATVLEQAEWNDASSGFLRTVRDGPRVKLT